MKLFKHLLAEATRKKIDKCPECMPDTKAAIFYPETDYKNNKPVWQCANCGYEKPRQVKKKKAGMSPSQKKILDSLQKNKKFRNVKIDYNEDFNNAFVTFEDNLDSILIRNNYHIVVGPSGKIEWLGAHGLKMDLESETVNRNLAHSELRFPGKPKWSKSTGKKEIKIT